jgi:fatty-acid desaturase
MEKITLLLNIASTFFLTGVIWVVQLVQYPSFAFIARGTFTKYHDDYRFWITPVVAPAMIFELLTSAFLVYYTPANINSKLVWLGLALTVLVWASTFFIQVPLHEKLARGFDAETHAALVNTNWLRTASWSARSLLVLYFAWLFVRP